uniref:Uncharacterized protein n=1 Tax=Anopheles atroparvus TaxID=41427 RepID=A0AAG5DNP0_ANOAO
MPCKTCGKDCKCLRMMSKRSCGTRSCDSDCTCPCNTASKNRIVTSTKNDQLMQCGSENNQGPTICDCVATTCNEERSHQM